MNSKLFFLSCSRIGLSIAIGMLASLMVEAAEKASRTDQLQAPTHRQVRLIEPKIDGKTFKLHTIATTADGHVLAAVGGQSIKYEMTASGYETKLVEEPSFVLMLDAEGSTLKQWELELTPSAITVASDGTIYVGGSGRIAKLKEDGSVSAMIDSPHVGSVKDLRKKTAESIRKSRAQMSDSFAGQIELLQERVERIEAKDEDDRSRLEDAQLKAFKTQLEMLEKLAGPQNAHETDEVEESQLDAAVMQTMSIISMAASDQDVFVCASDPSKGGYSIWRIGRDLDAQSSEVIKEGLRGCCGQMDIQCCGDDLLISENTRFRVGIYDRHGRARGSFGKRDRTSRAGFGSCCNPMNSLGMKDGTILTAESSIGHIKRFDASGNLVAYIGKASIGAGCKHCALGYDEQNDLYYMMYQDKNAICVLANSDSTPITVAEKNLQQRQIDFLARTAGEWSLKKDGEKNKAAGMSSFFGGGRGGATQHAVSSLKIGSDGSAKILEGRYKVYGDKSQLELLEETDSDPDTANFALAIDQVRFLEGTWKFGDKETATLTFQGHTPITLARSAASETCETACAGKNCTGADCQDENCPSAGKTETIAALELAEAEMTEVVELDAIESPTGPTLGFYDFEAQVPKPKFEYKLISRKQLGEDAESRLNELGAEGWEFCGKVGKKMMFKRISGFELTEPAE